ncbi:MAG: M23 family metallopeptidase [Aldersonia sp.]|nr:M23 family metallopeptidase [Aldersonia sp.]
MLRNGHDAVLSFPVYRIVTEPTPSLDRGHVLPQHRPSASSIPASSLAPLGANFTRHRAADRSSVRAAAVAVATGAVFATGYQLASPGVAAADPVTDALHAAHEAPGLPPEVGAAIDQAEQAWANHQSQFAPAAPAAVRPVNGPVSSGYGARWGSMHYGVDFADPIGAPIRSVSNGTVIEAGPASGFGLWVRVKQDDGTTAVYGHVNEIKSYVGQRVKAGDVIATVGNRGQSTGPHLHLEIWDANGRKTDPMPYLADRGVPLSYGAKH